MTQSVKDEAKFLDTRLDDETAAVLEKWNLVILGAALLHDADHIRQAIRWRYKIPMQLWIINLAVYVLPTVAEFLLKNKRTSSFLTVAANGIVTSAAFLKVHLFKPTTDIWGAWNYNYFKLARGVWHEGQFIKGIDWIDWALLLDDGVATGAMITREDASVGPDGSVSDSAQRARALADRTERYAVYGRAGLPCLRCGTSVVRSELAGRSLFHCPGCQR